ncbi:N-acetyltransferase [Blastococcus sp. TBT05-19]|uniref:GNAT family N-acetyltransferase n=1 Tax=Blastococcus sp. TBT05-19 TaxID=2250581 RepID=UPI000DE8BE4D|nr:GNAT family N-acetyltransferase [Blastococcus sp. TBT05-19]RBY88222.1 N-acetyltransferase [Blastococcus sp. TBT05-19]
MNPTPPFPRLTGTADVSVRPARPGDAPAIARVQAVTWRTAYRTVLPLDVLDGWDDDAVTASWAAAVATPPTPAHRVLVAVEREDVVGFAASAPVDDAADVVELGPLLVEPRWGRRGHGSRLLAAAIDLARADGAARARIWLPEPDRVSAGFFESAGWAADGWARTLETGGDPLRELRWHAELDGEDTP